MTTFPIIALADGVVLDPQWIADVTAAVNDHETRVDTLESQVAAVSATITDATSRTTASTSFTATLSGATPTMGVAFVAPTSGKVLLTWSAGMSNASAPNIAQMSPYVKNGSVVNSGTDVLVADAARSTLSVTGVRASGTYFLSGLTPGANYNVTAYHRSFSTGTSTFDNRELSVIPLVA